MSVSVYVIRMIRILIACFLSLRNIYFCTFVVEAKSLDPFSLQFQFCPGLPTTFTHLPYDFLRLRSLRIIHDILLFLHGCHKFC